MKKRKKKRKKDFVKAYGGRIKREVADLKETSRKLERMKLEALRELSLKERKQIDLVKEKAKRERKELLEKFDKKQILLGERILREKQRGAKTQLVLGKREIKKNRSAIQKLSSQISQIFPKKKKKRKF